jgi:hypothetical protein
MQALSRAPFQRARCVCFGVSLDFLFSLEVNVVEK